MEKIKRYLISTFGEKWKLALLLWLLCAILIAGYVFGFVDFILIDDFNDYTLGDINGKGNWNSPDGKFIVQNSVYLEGGKALEFDNSSAGVGYYAENLGILETQTGTSTFYIRSNDVVNSVGLVYWMNSAADYSTFIALRLSKIQYLAAGGEFITLREISNDTWYRVQVEWDKPNHGNFMKFSVEGGTTTDWTGVLQAWDKFVGIKLYGRIDNVSNKKIFWDYFDKEPFEEAPPEFRIWGINPASSTEIATDTESFTFGYEGFATSTWSGIIVNFCEQTTGICAKEKKYPKVNLEATSGQKTLTFKNFDFDVNSNWWLIGNAYYGTFNQNWMWVESYTGNVVSPDYYIVINFEGLPIIFTMEEPETWYAEHTEYATPTAFFSDFTNFLSPIFVKIGEFGSRVQNYFNQNEAHARGNNIGSILPTFGVYINEVSFLFGDFPLLNMFFVGIALLIGFFLFKLIIKVVRG